MKQKQILEELEIIATYVCIVDEDTEAQIDTTYNMIHDLIDKIKETRKHKKEE